jgi:hypothetical protein
VESVEAAWDKTEAYFADGTLFAAEFNTWLLRELRPRWAEKVRLASSHSRLLFMAPAAQPYKWSEHVYVEYQGPDRVEMALERNVPRQTLSKPGGGGVVTGDFARPENAVPAVEALLFQLDLADSE